MSARIPRWTDGHPFLMVPRAGALDSGLPDISHRLYVVLCWAVDERGLAQIPDTRLARLTGHHRSTVARHLPQLRRLGYISIVPGVSPRVIRVHPKPTASAARVGTYSRRVPGDVPEYPRTLSIPDAPTGG